MKKMRTLIQLFFPVLVSLATFAQSAPGSVSGTVKDTRNESIQGATVMMSKAFDSTIVRTQTTNVNGKFHFDNVNDGVYIISVTAIGQKQFTSVSFLADKSNKSTALPPFVMLPAKNVELATVVVKASRPLIEQEIDKTIVNVASMISSATSNALEVLEKTPGITVGANGEISLNGRSGVLVLIDGRSTYMSGSDLAAYLKSLPGSLLEKLELIDNPSAKYDAAGNAIINIRLKKTRTAGYTGNISTGFTQGVYARSNNGINLNYNHKKINLFSNIGYNRETNYNDDIFDRRFFNAGGEANSSVFLQNKQRFISKGLNLNLGLDYSSSVNTTYGFQLNINQSRRYGIMDYTSNTYNANKQLDTIGTGSTIGGDKKLTAGTNLNLLHKFGKTGRELSADINYLNYQTNGDQSLLNFIYLPDGFLTGNNEFLYNVPSEISIYTLKADYIHPLKRKAKLEAGFKSSIVYNNNVADYFDVIGGLPKIDNGKSNHFRYRESINAAYINAQKSWKRLGAQLGLRIEDTRAVGRQLGNDVVPSSHFTKNYTELFPAIFLSYKLDTLSKNDVAFSLTRRINRPNYQFLNPFVFFRDKYSYTAGNPMLTPQYQYRYELRYVHRQLLRITLSYNRFTDVIIQNTQAVNDIFITRPENVAEGFMLLLNTGLSLAPAKWWSLNSDILLSRIGLNGRAYTEKLHISTFVARINVVNQFRFTKGWSAELGAYYASRDITGQAITGGMICANGGVQKKIWKDKGSIRLNFDDIFHSWIYHNRSVSLKQASYFQTSESDTQRIGIAFTYRFGMDNFARKRRHADNAADEEKGRVDHE
ncbi:MAG: outer membrane beta-barrel protein [Chitinophagaceae bacterium]